MNATSAYTPDRPHNISADGDAFGHADYASALTQVLVAAPTPFTVGVFGEWGVGKSTILLAVKEQLPEDVAFVLFDAWRYEGDVLRRQLLLDVAQQLHDTKRLDDFDMDKDLRDLHVEVSSDEDGGLRISGSEAVRSLVTLVSAFVLFFVLLRTKTTGSAFSSHGAVSDGALALIGAVALAVMQAVAQPLKVEQRTLTTRRIEEPDQFTDVFKKLMRAVKARRVVVAIDNLDRCSPDQAVEVLSTIKTYLEPSLEREQETGRRFLGLGKATKQPVEAVFLIAADNDALRRHLVGQESQRSEGTPEHEVVRYVDEYLRKFFSATVPVRSVLDEDVRAFLHEHLEPLLVARGHESSLARMVELCNSGLHRNPRRIKQFANNLELRLDLLVARERPDENGVAKIEPPISDELLVVAKVLMIEEEWPTRFRELMANPRLLAEWEQQARERGLPPGDSTEDGPAGDAIRADRERFGAFLRQTADVKPRNDIRAFLSLKQPPSEVKLPGFHEFRGLVTADEREGATRFIGDDPVHIQACAEALPHILNAEVSEKYLVGARAVLDIAVSVPQFAALPVAGDLVRSALGDPDLRLELANLDARAVLGVARDHAPDVYEDAECLFAAEFEREMKADAAADGQSRLQELASALTSHEGPLSVRAREMVVNGIVASPARYTEALALFESDPTLTTEEVADHAVAAVTTAELPAGQLMPPGELGPDGAAWTFVERALEQGKVKAERQDVLLNQFGLILNATLFGDTEHLRAVLPRIIAILALMNAASDEARKALFDHLQEPGMNPPADSEARLAILDLRREIASGVSNDGQRNALEASAASFFFAPDPDPAVAIIVERPQDIALSRLVESHLVEIARSQPQHSVAASEAIAAISENTAQILKDLVVHLFTQGRHPAALEIVRRRRPDFGEESAPLIDALLASANQAGPPVAALPFVVELADALTTPEQIPSVQTLLVSQISFQQPPHLEEALNAFAALETRPGFAPVVDPVLDQILTRMEEAPQYSAHLQAPELVGFLTQRFSRLSESQRARLLARLSSWLVQAPTHVGALRTPFEAVANSLSESEHEVCTTAALQAEQTPGLALNMREELLGLALAIAGDGRKKPGKAVRQRLAELETPANAHLAGMVANVRERHGVHR